MFPKSEIAKKYGSARTKTTAIMRLMAKEEQLILISRLQKQTFAVATDGSNDTEKLYPLVVTYFNHETSLIDCNLLCVPILKGDCTGRNIGNLIVENLATRDIPIENCIALGCDNANVMIGRKNGVAAVMSEAHNNIIIMGCLCHLTDIAAGRAINSLSIKIDEILVDIYYYLKRSCKRKERLKQFQVLHDTEMKIILKHVETRWLSIGRCLNRILEQWDPLSSFFDEEITAYTVKRSSTDANLDSYKIPKVKISAMNSKNEVKKKHKTQDSNILNVSKQQILLEVKKQKQNESNDKINETFTNELKCDPSNRNERIHRFLLSNLNKAFCLFLQNVIPVFEKLSTLLQTWQPLIHILRKLITDFYKELLSKFIKPDVVKNYSSPLNVDYHSRHHQKDDHEIVVGSLTSKIVNSLKKEDKAIFFLKVRKYFITALDYIYHSFPHKSDILINAEVLNPSTITFAEFSKLRFFIDKFPVILFRRESETEEEALDILQSQFCELQMEDLPQNIKDEQRIDTQWTLIGNMQNGIGDKKYERLAQVMLSLLVIPNSNAECERIFSQVKKVRTDFRASLSNETLENLLVTKYSKKTKCFEDEFSKEFLIKAKSATSAFLVNK